MHVEVAVRVAQRESVFLRQRAVGAFVEDVQADAVVRRAQPLAVAGVHQRLHGARAHLRVHQVAWVAVQPEVAALVENPLQVVGVRGVVGVVDLHALQVHALLLEDGDLAARHLAGGIGMNHDRHAGFVVGARHGAVHDFQLRRDALEIRRAFEQASLHVRAAKALFDVAHELARHLIRRDVADEARHVEPPAGDVDDVHAGGGGDRAQQLGIAPQVERGGVHEGVDARRLGLLERGNRALLAVRAEQVRIAAVHPRRTHHDVLVHQREAQLVCLDGPGDGVDPHGCRSFLGGDCRRRSGRVGQFGLSD